MASKQTLDYTAVLSYLDRDMELEFTCMHTGELAQRIAVLGPGAEFRV